ncbi:MAG: hypothetical protein KDI64_20395, partial [Candidatus Accumulibacter sp.]|nr:hypothetical protein [Accumulibacter sp.]
RLSNVVGPALRSLSQLVEAVKELVAESEGMGVEIEEARSAREASCSELACMVDRVEGETRINALLVKLADTPLSSLPGKDLKRRLRKTDPAAKKLFSGSAGSFSWAYQTP